MKLTSDGQYVVASGGHPPQLRVFDLTQLSMKFERTMDSEIVDFQILSEDWSKMAVLCADRSVALHARYGKHFTVRFPTQGRDLTYLPFLADLVVVGTGSEIFRLSLSEGRFLTPLASQSSGINASGYSPAHGLFAAAGEDGILECFDMRSRESVGALDAASAAGVSGRGLTALRFDESGMHIAVGTETGQVALYDLRSSRPLQVKDHMYDAPIVDIKFQRARGDTLSERKVSRGRGGCCCVVHWFFFVE